MATAVVLKPGCLASAQDIQEHIAREAAQYKVPHHVFFVPALPKTATGKPQRLLLSKRFAGETASRGEAPAPDLDSASPLQRELHAIWSEVLGFKGFSLRDNFFYQGGDSLGVIRVLAEVRRRLGRELDPAVFLRSPTVQQLAAEIGVAAVGAGEPEVVALQAAGSRRPFHMLGGSLPFLDFVHRFHPPADQPFFLIPPLTLDYLPPRPAVAAIARQHLATLRAHQPHGPYCLIGYCFHGVVVHEMACELVAQGESVPRLVLVDTTPSRPDLRQKVVALLDFLRRRGYTGAPDEGPVMAAWLNRATRFQTWSRSGWDFKRQTLAGLLGRRLRWRLRRPPLAPAATPTPTPPVTSADEIYGGLMLNRYMLALAGHTMRQFPGPVELFLSEEYRRQTALPPDRGWERWAASVRLHALRGGHDDCLLTDAAGFGRRLAELGVTPEAGPRVNRPGKDGHRTGHAGEQRRKVVAT